METETIDRVLQEEPPYHEIDEMEAEDFGRRVQCCRSIPCPNPEECPR